MTPELITNSEDQNLELNKEKLNKNLVEASSDNDINAVISLLKQGADPLFHLHTVKSTALMNTSSLEIADLLIKHGADVNAKGVSGDTALMFFNSIELSKLLLESGSDINAKNYRHTVLMKSIYYDNKEMVKLLIDHGVDVNAKNQDGLTALMLSKTPEITAILLNHGVDFDAIDKKGNTALMKSELPEITKLLIDAGADVNKENRHSYTALTANLFQNEDFLTLTSAENEPKIDFDECQRTYEQRIEILKLIIDAKANVNHQRECNGYTPLMMAGSRDIAQLLLDADPDISIKNWNGIPAHEIQDGEVKKLLKICYENHLLLNAAVSSETKDLDEEDLEPRVRQRL